MPWIFRGLRNGVVTTGWPKRPDAYFASWAGVATPLPGRVAPSEAVAGAVCARCPTGAIHHAQRRLVVDQGSCIGCGLCVAAHPDLLSWQQGSGVARLARGALVVPEAGKTHEDLAALRESLAERVRAFGRSVHIRHVDAGSDGSEEWEIAALLNPVYDIHRLGLFFTASPRHADVLLVTGIGATGMQAPLQRTLEAMPSPVVVVAVGSDACSGGLLSGSYASCGGVGGLVGVDVWVPGSPPSPFAILHGLLVALGRLPQSVEEPQQ